MVYGVILEANPLHKGHLYFFDQIKKEKDDYVIAVTSGNFSLRGEISLISKSDKIKYLLQTKIDLIFEIPMLYTLNASSSFAEAAVKTLKLLGVQTLVMGSEEENIQKFWDLIAFEKTAEFKKLYEEDKKAHKSLKQFYEKVILEKGFSSKLLLPNSTLALEYLRIIDKNQYNIDIKLIKRELNENLKSATLIKKEYLKGLDVSSDLAVKEDLIDLKKARENLFLLAKFKYLNNDFYNDAEGINNYLKKVFEKASSYDDFLEIANNKKYSNSRIRRSILLTLLKANENITQISDYSYLRLLGFNEQKDEYLKQLSKEIKALIFSKPKNLSLNNQLIYDVEAKANKLYQIITDNKYPESKYPIRRKA